MTVTSMTGFARVEGRLEIADGIAADWAWEIKSVNAKGLDIRFRWPPGCDHLDASARPRWPSVWARGAVTANASVAIDTGPANLTVNEALLDQILAAQARLAAAGRVDSAPPRLDSLLTVRGMLEQTERGDLDPTARAALAAALLAGLATAAQRLGGGATARARACMICWLRNGHDRRPHRPGGGAGGGATGPVAPAYR